MRNFIAGLLVGTAVTVCAQAVDRTKIANARANAIPLAVKLRDGQANQADKDALLLRLAAIVLAEDAP